MKKRVSRILIIIMLVTLTPNVDAPIFAAGKIKLNKTKMSLYIGDSKILKLKGTKKQAKWSSSNKAVATVSKKGKVVAVRKGTTTIKAKLGKKTYKCKVSVKNKKSIVKYDKKLIKDKLKNIKDYDVVGSNDDQLKVQLPLNDNTEKIITGDVIMLPANEEYLEGLAIKVKNVSKEGSNIEIDGETPSIEDVFDKIDIAKSVSTESCELLVNKEIVKNVTSDNKPLQTSNEIRTLKDYEINEKIGENFKISLDDKDTGISGSVKFYAPIVTAVIDADLLGIPRINALNIDVENKADINVNACGAKKFEPIYLACIPNVKLGYGFMVDVVFELYFEADGRVSVKCSIKNNTGFDYKQGKNISPYRNITKTVDNVEAEVSGKLLFSSNANIRFLGRWDNKEKDAIREVSIIGVQVRFGPGIGAVVTGHNSKPYICLDLDLYACLDLGITTDEGLGKKLKEWKIKTSWELLGISDNNPFRTALHFEDGTKVPKCTYKQNEEKTSEDFAKFAGTYGYFNNNGNWMTRMTVNKDGSFTGNFHETTGEDGNGYQYTIYNCNYSGKFTFLEKVNTNHYRASVEKINCEDIVGTEKIIDGVRYVAVEPYGVDSPASYDFYLKGTSKTSLPKGFIESISSHADTFKDGKLIRNGIYNSKSNAGFF